MNYSKETISRYRESYRRQQSDDAIETETRRQNALTFGKKMANMLGLQHGARQVVLIGSALDPERFNKSSDIDLVVYQMPKENYFNAVAACMNADFDVDLIPFESAHELVLKAVSKGVVVYEI
jgi:predicted nucleotidyltransferase